MRILNIGLCVLDYICRYNVFGDRIVKKNAIFLKYV